MKQIKIPVCLVLFVCALLYSCENGHATIKDLQNEAWRLDSMHNYKASILIYDEIISMDPGNYMAFGSRGNAKAERGDTAGALADYGHSIQMHPVAVTLVAKSALLQHSNPVGSLYCLNVAKQLYPTDPITISGFIFYYTEMDPVKDSAIRYAEMLNIPELKSLYPLFATMSAYLQFEEVDKLLEVTNQILEIDPTVAYAYNNRGYAELQKGDIHSALVDINKSLSFDAKNSYAYKNLGLAYIKINKIDSACIYLNKAARLGYTETYGPIVDSLRSTYCK